MWTLGAVLWTYKERRLIGTDIYIYIYVYIYIYIYIYREREREIVREIVRDDAEKK